MLQLPPYHTNLPGEQELRFHHMVHVVDSQEDSWESDDMAKIDGSL